MEQLQVYNPNDGTWKRMGGSARNDSQLGATVLNCPGDGSTVSEMVNRGDYRHPLTPCDPPKAYTLGQDVEKYISEGDVIVAGGELLPGNRLCLSSGQNSYNVYAGHHNTKAAVLIFETPPPPAPEPKTDRAVLEEVIAAWDGDQSLFAALKLAEKHLAAQSDTPE